MKVNGLLSVALTSAIVGCAHIGAPSIPSDPKAACEQLNRPIAASLIGLPTTGATIDSATLVAATELAVAAQGPTPAATITPAAPQTCRVLGRIAPVDASAPPILFQVNLPTTWNGRSLQFGGGGFNGVLISGLALPPGSRFDAPGPLAQGFVTVGTDSGHQNAPNVPVQAFAANQESFENFAHMAYKKVRDVSVELMKRRYGKAPEKLYFMGSSEGGREAVMLAQKYPKEFNGLFARVPVINWTGLQHAYLPPNFQMRKSGGWLSPAHVKLLGDAVTNACDELDGVRDGIVSHSEECRRTFDVSRLRCSFGQAESDCLSDAQIDAVNKHHQRYTFDFPLANGITSYPARGMSGEATPGTGSTGGWVSWLTGREAPAWPAKPTNSIGWNYGSGTIAHFIAKNPTMDIEKYNPNDYKARVQEISAMMDYTNPDLSALHAAGNKLIILEYMADYAQSPYAGIEYFESVVQKMGAANTEQFLRLYTAPHVDHVGTGAPGHVNMLDALVNWVEKNQAPQTLEVVEQINVAPFVPSRARPLCRWPEFPQYKGAGDVNAAASFVCSKG